MHHQRRKSGHGSANTSYTDVKKAVTVSDPTSRHKATRPAMTRRNTPSHKLGKSPRNREREMEDEYWLSDERESFPLFWYVSPTSPPFVWSCFLLHATSRISPSPVQSDSMPVPLHQALVRWSLTLGWALEGGAMLLSPPNLGSLAITRCDASYMMADGRWLARVPLWHIVPAFAFGWWTRN